MVDHVELSADGRTVLIALDAVDANWFDGSTFGQADGSDSIHHDKLLPPSRGQTSPFEDAPLYRVEVELSSSAGPAFSHPFGYRFPANYQSAGDPNGWLSQFEKTWFQLSFSKETTPGAVPALVYSGLFAPPVTVYVQGTMPSATVGKLLSKTFTFAHLAQMNEKMISGVLKPAFADLLAAYDVGQGNSNAFLYDRGHATFPTLYYDLGAGVYRNKDTTPAKLIFCLSKVDTIVLSHWDSDHWAGAYAMAASVPTTTVPAKGIYPALAKTWIAPFQIAGPVHIAFAYDIISNGGDVYLYKPVMATTLPVVLSCSRTLYVSLGSGGDRNNSGIVFMVEDTRSGSMSRWLLTGDCSYRNINGDQTDKALIALVAPHHGATLEGAQAVPVPDKGGYARLIYSFGSDNKHPHGVQHPTKGGVALHQAGGWSHGAWNLSEPGDCLAGADVLHTEQHVPGGGAGGQLGGAVVGWNSVPAVPVHAPCGGKYCGTRIKQA
jgi:beta-lactamase superfamily II metal-dependent hydrolase